MAGLSQKQRWDVGLKSLFYTLKKVSFQEEMQRQAKSLIRFSDFVFQNCLNLFLFPNLQSLENYHYSKAKPCTYVSILSFEAIKKKNLTNFIEIIRDLFLKTITNITILCLDAKYKFSDTTLQYSPLVLQNGFVLEKK